MIVFRRYTPSKKESEIIITINKIDDKGVTLLIDGEEIVLEYNSTRTIKSRYVVFALQKNKFSTTERNFEVYVKMDSEK